MKRNKTPATDGGTGTSGPPREFPAWLISPAGRLIRYLLVLALVVTALVGLRSGWFDFCETVSSAEKVITKTCGGPDLTSAAVLAAVLLILLLLWPDLSEFSAFGVTLKKLVERVEQTVDETSKAVGRVEVQTSSIDRATAATRSTATDLREDLRDIRAGVAALNERDWSAFVASSSNAAPTPAIEARWDYHDQQNLLALCATILGPEVLAEKRTELLARVSSVNYESVEYLMEGRYRDAEKALLTGILIDRYILAVSNAPSYSIREDDARLEQRDRLLRLTRQLLGAAMEGRMVFPDTFATAAATLAEINPS